MKSPVRVSLLLAVTFSLYASAAPLSDTNPPAARAGFPVGETVQIPGPLRSFERMSGISQEISAADVLPLFARKVYMQGYQQGKPTEFLVLIDRYLQQARELEVLAGADAKIKVSNCDDAGTLIRVLGYRLRPGCGQKTFSLETADPARAFLTIDSGFPLVELEEALQNGTPFVYPYSSSHVTALFRSTDWSAISNAPRKGVGSLVDILLGDPAVSRLYWSMSQQDAESRQALQRSPGLRALLPYAGTLEFYGSQICVRSNRVQVPGGPTAQPAWRELTGANPDSPGQFVTALLTKDKGWLAAYFDALSRVNQAQQKHLTEPARLKHVYESFRTFDPSLSPTAGVFRKTPDLLVMFTRLQWEPDGSPHIPGDVDAWKDVLNQKSGSKATRDLGRRARSWNRPEQLLEGMAGLSQVETDIGPLQIFLLTIEIDRQRERGNRLSPATVRTLANRFSQFSTWYQVFTEFPALDDASIVQFVNVADAIDKIPNKSLRANAEGSFQATLGLWQILARQTQISNGEMNVSWQKTVGPFATVSTSAQLFDASRASLSTVLSAAGAKPNASQNEIVDLLAGPRQVTPDGQHVHTDLGKKIGSVLEDQRLVSLDTLFALNDGLKNIAQTGAKDDALLPLAAELREFDLPQPIFTHSEKVSWAPPIYTEQHQELQVRTDLTKIIKGPATKAQLETARGQLAPFLRDTLVGLNYAYYEPPDDQMLHHNPLFVRSHDFLGISVLGSDRLWGAPRVLGVGTPAGGGAYLMGSLSDLSYALATTEEDFIAPRSIQALILKELAPVLIVSATIPRWWGVTPNELHAVTLYQRSGEELVTAAASDPQLKTEVLDILTDRMSPQQLADFEASLQHPEQLAAALPLMEPAVTCYLASEFRSRHPGAAPWGAASRQLEDLRSRYATEVSWERISRDFGVPHPTLAQTNARELLNLKPFPFFGSYSSRLFGESWESNNLYWARLADEMGYSPAALNTLVPQLTRHMIANTSATDLDDWPAVLRAMQKTGEEFRQGKIAPAPAANVASRGPEQMAKEIAQ